MPRDILIVGGRAPSFAELVEVARSLDASLLPVRGAGGAAVRLVGPAHLPVLTVQYSIVVGNREEIRRLAPEALDVAALADGPVSWTEAWVPWEAAADVGVRIARELAARCGAVCIVEDGTR